MSLLLSDYAAWRLSVYFGSIVQTRLFPLSLLLSHGLFEMELLTPTLPLFGMELLTLPRTLSRDPFPLHILYNLLRDIRLFKLLDVIKYISIVQSTLYRIYKQALGSCRFIFSVTS